MTDLNLEELEKKAHPCGLGHSDSIAIIAEVKRLQDALNIETAGQLTAKPKGAAHPHAEEYQP